MVPIIKSFRQITLLRRLLSIISVSVIQAATQQSNTKEEKAILQITPQKEISSRRAKQVLKKAEFSYGEVKGNVQVKDKNISDSLVVKEKKNCNKERKTWCVGVNGYESKYKKFIPPVGENNNYENPLTGGNTPTRGYTYPFWFEDSWQ